MKDLLEVYQDVKECVYKNEHYSVRDNGAVLRYSIDGKRIRPLDNKWNFGKLNCKNGYLEIASVRIHRIVATAFHGEAPTKEHVVDHIDTNKQNNRPENLRWVTRLENILLNPITASRIAYICGSVEEFLANPISFKDKFPNPNYSWMATVSVEEALVCKEKLLALSKSENPLVGGSLDEWLFSRNIKKEYLESVEERIEYINSLTNNAIQVATNWKTKTEFPCCPQDDKITSIKDYQLNLQVGNVFSKNQYTTMIIERFAISEDEQILWIVCKSEEEDSIKPFTLTEVSYQNNNFVHKALGSFFEKVGAEKQFNLVQGNEWKGEDTIDDYC